MSAFESQFEEHAVHGVLSQVQATLGSIDMDGIGPDSVDHIDRIRQATAFISDRLDGASPVLNSAARLNGIQKHLQGCLNEINQFNSNRNAGHITNASNQIDGAINNAAVIVTIGDKPPSVSVKDSVSFKELAEDIIKSLNDKAGAVSESFEASKEKITELTTKVKENKDALDATKNALDSKLQELQSQFDAAQADRNAKYEEFVNQLSESSENSVGELTEKMEYELEAIEEKRSEAEKIVNLIGNIGLTGNFRGAATEEKKTADLMRWIALGCFGAMALVVLSTLFFSVSNGFDPWVAIFRVTAALTLIVPATYAARESSKHRALEARNRRAELELASIDAYLESLPDERKAEIKASLTGRFFGQIEDRSESDRDIKPDSIISLLKDAINQLGKK